MTLLLAALLFQDLPLLVEEGFGADAGKRWEPTDPKAWRVAKEGDNPLYELFAKSDYQPPVRSPENFALLKDVSVTDFVLEARLKSTVKEYGHRDLCLIFGHQDPSHFYYLHLATAGDANAHSIFIVDGKPRASIAKERTQGVEWGDGWHTVRVTRTVESGKTEVFFDDLKTPIMKAEDKTFAWGRIGIGSFDDTGRFDDVKLWGRKK